MLSYGEKLLRAYVKRCFPKHKQLFNFREAGIVNPDTGFPLEIDIFLPELKIGFEFHGRQHKTDESQRNRDKHKRKQCKELGIKLFEIWALTLTQNLYEKIKEEVDVFVKKPDAKFLLEFKTAAENYKNNIYKMNKGIKSDSFVRRKNGKNNIKSKK
ncbi:MAG: hypothetical protein ACRCX2_35905 [Paraclostridium sp.]